MNAGLLRVAGTGAEEAVRRFKAGGGGGDRVGVVERPSLRPEPVKGQTQPERVVASSSLPTP